MKYILNVACIFLKSAWQAVFLRLALTALLLGPLAWESALREDGIGMRRRNEPAKSPNP
jgi:hypothetical protein